MDGILIIKPRENQLQEVFGDLNDPNSEISMLVATIKTEDWHPEYGTKPMTPYIAPDKEIFKAADGPLNE